MTVHIVFNGREVHNPVARFFLIVMAGMLAALLMAVIVFILLPLAGIVITLSSGIILVFMAAISMGVVFLVGMAVFGDLLERFSLHNKK